MTAETATATVAAMAASIIATIATTKNDIQKWSTISLLNKIL